MSFFPTIYKGLTINGENLVVLYARKNNTAALAQLTTGKSEEINDCIYGYAWGQHDNEVQDLLAGNADLAPYAVRGYARAGNIDMVEKLIEHYPKTKGDAVYGYAQAGMAEQVYSAFRSIKSNIYFLPAILGSASTNQKQLMFEVLSGTIYTFDAIQAAAKNGQTVLVDELLSYVGINLKQKFELSLNQKSTAQFNHLNKALQGFIDGGHFAAAARLIELGANPFHAASALFNNNNGITVESAHIVLAHIHDNSTRASTLSEMLKTDLRLQKSDFDFSELEKISSRIHEGVNYLQATNAEKQKSGHISISMLSEMFLSEYEDEIQEMTAGLSFH